jgi:hypothetical protein
MSYVVQNFLKLNQYTTVTPRFKIFFSLQCISFFIFIFKFSNILTLSKHVSSFLNFFFAKGLFNFFHKLSINLSANYVNTLTRTGVYWNFKLLYESFETNKIFSSLVKLNDFLHFNSYVLSIKLVNFKLNKTYFKNFFFLFSFFSLKFDTNFTATLVFIWILLL